MTHQDLMALLGPLLAALVMAAATIVGAVATGIAGRLRAYLDAKGQAEAGRVLADANGRMQDAMANAAGTMALKVQTGQLDLTDEAAVLAEGHLQAAKVMAKLPTLMEVLQPIQGAIAEGIVGKLGLGTLAAGSSTAPVGAAA